MKKNIFPCCIDVNPNLEFKMPKSNKYKVEVVPEMCEKGESKLHAGVEKEVDEVGKANLKEKHVK